MELAKTMCKCPCHKATGFFIILFGATFLLKALNVLSEEMTNIIWPAILILAGGKKLVSGCKCCNNG